MLLMSDSLHCIQILAPSPLCVMLCSVPQEQFFCPISDRYFHSFQSPPHLLVVAPHLPQDELCPWMDTCLSATMRPGEEGVVRADRSVPLVPPRACPSTDAV